MVKFNPDLLPQAFKSCPICHAEGSLSVAMSKESSGKNVKYLLCTACRSAWVDLIESGMKLVVGPDEHKGFKSLAEWANLSQKPLDLSVMGKQSQDAKKISKKTTAIGCGAFLITVILLAVGIGTCLGGSEDPEAPPIPQSAIDEIYAITQNELVNKYVEVIDAEDKPGYFAVILEIKYVPGMTDTLEDFYSQAKVYTDAGARDAVKILTKYGIDKDVSVWGRLIFSKDEIVLLGRTWYNAKLKSYNFERYKP